MVHVMQMMANGESYAQIARAVGITESGLRNAIVTYTRATGTDSNRHLVAYGFRKGLIS